MPDLTIQKKYTVSLPREKLFAAWISPESVIAPVTKIEVNPTVGGYLKLFVESPNGTSIMNGRFITLSPPSQLIYTWEWDNSGEVTHITVNFVDVDEGTEITILHSGFHSEESRAMHDTGWDSYVNGVVQKLENK